MAFCKNCGAELEEDERFCGKCGVKVKGTNNYLLSNQCTYPIHRQRQCMMEDRAEGLEEYSDREVQSGKLMGVLSYCSFLVLIPLLAQNDNRFVRFHVNQGMILFAGEMLLVFSEMIMPVFADISMIFVMLFWFFQLNITVWTGICSFFGIVNVLQGEAVRIPGISRIKNLK